MYVLTTLSNFATIGNIKVHYLVNQSRKYGKMTIDTRCHATTLKFHDC
jgi:hypothetical protein